ncbi:hypothetical protein R6Q57_001928 [Mikania cordata]
MALGLNGKDDSTMQNSPFRSSLRSSSSAPLLNVFIYKESPFSRREEGKLSSRSLLVFPSSKKENETRRKRNEHFAEERSFVFLFLQSPNPLSFAATNGVSVDFPSFSYSDVSVAKFEKSKERRLATELGYGFPIGDPWITDGISPWPFASESVLPYQYPASIQCILFDLVPTERYTEHQPNRDEKKKE